MRVLRSSVLLLAAAALLAVSTPACSCDQESNNCNWCYYPFDAFVDPTPDAGLDGGQEDASSVADAWVWVTVPCDATFIQLPSNWQTATMGIQNWRNWVVYDDAIDPYSDKRQDVFLYDLDTCTEYQLTDEVGTQLAPGVWRDEVIWTDFRAPETWDDDVLMSFQLDTTNRMPLLQINALSMATFNDRYLVFYSTEGEIQEQSYHPVLWDRWTDDELIIAEAWQGAEHFSISETHLAWIASCPTCGGAADVFYLDLDTWEIVHLEDTIPGHQLHPSTWGDYVLWQDDRNTGYWTVYAHCISTGESWKIIDDPIPRGYPHIRGHLVTWGTARYTYPDYQTEGGDVVIYDMETAVLRRATERSAFYETRYAHGDWLVYQEFMGSADLYKIYALNIRAAGLVDDEGHLIPE